MSGTTAGSVGAVSASEPASAARIAAMLGPRLEHYVERGVFRGSSPVHVRDGVATAHVVWHGGRTYEVTADAVRGALRFAGVLRAVPARSEMDRALRRFVASRQSTELPAHRRVDALKVRARVANRAGAVSIVFDVLDGDWEYATRKIVHLIDEVFQVFVRDGRWYEYRVEYLGLDPDRQ